MRWRPSCITNATKRPWRRYIVASASSMRDAAGMKMSDARQPAVAETIEAEPAQIDSTSTNAPKKDPSAWSTPRWTLEEKKTLIEACKAGVSTRTMLDRLPGRTLNSLEGMLKRYETEGSDILHTERRKKWPSDERLKILQLVQAGVKPQDAMPHFSGRSHKTICQIYGICKRNPVGWINGSENASGKWTAAEKERFRELVTQQTPTSVIAETLQRSVRSILKAIRTPGPWWTPERDAALSRMRMDGQSHAEIASHLGTNYLNVTRRWGEIKPRAASHKLKARDIRKFVLTLSATQLSEIEALREEGTAWDAIRAMHFPHVTRSTLTRVYKKQRGIVTTTKRPTVSPTLELSDADFEEIVRLRKEGATWPRIIGLKYPGRSRTSISQVFRRESKIRSGEQARVRRKNAPLSMSSADVEDIERLRNEGKSWQYITALKYPDRDPPQMMRAINRHRKEHSDG
jgi:transposase